ncbi:MAG: alpha/beta fold hydrolase [Verrucomicrobiota bacterium]|nr:alpha/beta fold hydrolase [Verrucomicrobiota bacterium]
MTISRVTSTGRSTRPPPAPAATSCAQLRPHAIQPPNFVEDLDEVRGALGYEKINLNGGSFGTYAGLIYTRRYPARVRTAYLNSLIPLSNRVPLYHAAASQGALDELFKECDEDAACHAAYPGLRENFATLMKKLHAAPVLTTVPHPVTGEPTEIHLSERAFGDALRVMMYRAPSAREIPFLLEQAMAGDFRPIAAAALRSNRGIYTGARLGLNYAITCNEFLAASGRMTSSPRPAAAFSAPGGCATRWPPARIGRKRSYPPATSSRSASKPRRSSSPAKPTPPARTAAGAKKSPRSCRTPSTSSCPAPATPPRTTASAPCATPCSVPARPGTKT